MQADSISIAIASSFWVGIAAAILAATAVLFLPEVPMRETFEMEDAGTGGADRTRAGLTWGKDLLPSRRARGEGENFYRLQKCRPRAYTRVSWRSGWMTIWEGFVPMQVAGPLTDRTVQRQVANS